MFNRYWPRNYFSSNNISSEYVLSQETQHSHGFFSYTDRFRSSLNAAFDRCTSREFCHHWHSPNPCWNCFSFSRWCIAVKTVWKAERGELKVREKILYESSFFHFIYFSRFIVTSTMCEM